MTAFATTSSIVIPCAKGIPPTLKEELVALGFPVLAETVASVATEGTLADSMRLNLYLRTGNRVLFLVGEFPAANPDDLYRNLSQIAWETWIPEDGTLCVTSAVANPTIRDTRFANVKCKDAVVDRIKSHCGRRPDSGPERTGVVLFLHWRGDDCRIYLDTSGEPLSRRGYRKIPCKAPLQETIAAAVLLTTGWEGNGHFINPMCGSGTLAIEAALIGLDKAPGLLRSEFGFMHLKGFPEGSWRQLRQEAKRRAQKALSGRIIATDIDPKAVAAAKKNAATAGVEHLLEFAVCDYAETLVPEGGGVILLNPEYGERLGKREFLVEVYKGIGDFFKQKGSGYRGYVFTGNLELAKKVGLRPTRRIPFFNSKIECRLLEYELYEGSRKPAKNVQPAEDESL